MEKKRMTLNVAGQDFRITSTGDEEYMKELAARVGRRISAVSSCYPQQSISRCALLAMLEMEEELNSLRTERDEVERKINELRTIREGESAPVQAPVKRPFARANAAKKPVGV